MQRWEYKVLSFDDGRYTARLNDYGRDGWELIAVVPDEPAAPTAEKGSRLPVPGTLGKIGEAASRIEEMTGDPARPVSNLLWVLRRPLDDD
ncbi:MAG TPA: hypothetical protein VFB25_10560 [Gaiellaceae bacterium]|nr:hypothetical protein [Gaiellaceae bacterium]